MKQNASHLVLVAPFLVLATLATLVTLATLAACGGVPGEEAASPQVVRELNRADAIASAKEDALQNYGAGWGSRIDASYQGGFWVVELSAQSGYKLRYAISARDGSIRERNMIQ
jgi:hypothetical protein